MKRRIGWMVGAVAGTALFACNGEEESNGSCSEDFDCPVGEVCNGATADAKGSCTAASPGAERDFGRVALSFAGDETYLLGLFALPTGEAAADENPVTFTLSAGGGAGGALRLARPARPAVELDQAYWTARLRVEKERRAAIDRLVGDLRAGRRSVTPAALRQAGDCSACAASTTEMCWQGSCTSAPVLTSAVDGNDLPCTLVGVVSSGDIKVNVLLDDDDDTGGARSAATSAATAFAQAVGRALDFIGQNSGHAGSLDRDNDGRMTVVFTEKLTNVDPAYVGGFSFKDFLPATDSEASGNEADLMWARVPTAQTMATCPPTGCSGITQELAIGTMVHEYTHLVNFAVRVYGAGAAAEENETLWLDEAMAHLMEDVCGFGASNVGAAAYALDQWPNATFAGPEDSVEQRGMAYLLLRHIVDRQGAASGAANALAANGAYKIHGLLADESARGFLHTPFQSRGADGIWQWMLATFATNNAEVTETAAQTSPYLPPVTVPQTGQRTGFDPFGIFSDARGLSITMQGPGLGDGSTDELTDFSEPFSSEIEVSSAVYYLVNGIDGELVLTGRGDAFTDFHLRAQRVW